MRFVLQGKALRKQERGGSAPAYGPKNGGPQERGSKGLRPQKVGSKGQWPLVGAGKARFYRSVGKADGAVVYDRSRCVL
ncbi:hypothetical protein GCM10027256_02950 [Novispirillum itersonii subsp. nipponicum]